MKKEKETKICIIGLGYVGEPLFFEFSKHFITSGYDINHKKVSLLKKKIITEKKLSKLSSDITHLKHSNIFIVCVPTPIYKNKTPDLRILKQACIDISKVLKRNDIIIFESTVYPGTTENICIPLIENRTKLKLNIDFSCGYSPERINPGDAKNTLSNIKKIVSASNKKTLNFINKLYSKIIKAGIYKAPSIQVAEAAKVIENSQRDINIAFINELAKIFDKMDIDIFDILDAASTKWNFLNFKPGLVGGHCIGVDPYYLSYISKKKGINPQVILAGRNTNDSMANFYVKKILRLLDLKFSSKKRKKILFMGVTFKENVDDLRNSKVFDIIDKLSQISEVTHIYDPLLINKKNIEINNMKFKILQNPKLGYYDIIIISVAHDCFKNMGKNKIKMFGNKDSVIFDIKKIFKKDKRYLYV